MKTVRHLFIIRVSCLIVFICCVDERKRLIMEAKEALEEAKAAILADAREGVSAVFFAWSPFDGCNRLI